MTDEHKHVFDIIEGNFANCSCGAFRLKSSVVEQFGVQGNCVFDRNRKLRLRAYDGDGKPSNNFAKRAAAALAAYSIDRRGR